MLALAFLILIHKLLQLLAEDPPVIAAHLCAADKTCFRTLDADQAFRRMVFCCHGISRLMKKVYFSGWSKMHRCKAPEILRSEAYLKVRCNDEGRGKRRRWAFFNSLLN